MPNTKAILVLGATGKQGGAVIRNLLAHPSFSSEKYTIYASTRDPTSASAQRLTGLSPSIRPVEGDLAGSAFGNLPKDATIWAVFGMTNPGKTEASDGRATIDAASRASVSHIVYTTVDRGVGSPATTVPHFISKHEIEEHLRQVADRSEGKLSYTIIRPPFFLDNLQPGFVGRVFATLLRDRIKASTQLAMVDTVDIGICGAAALLEPSSATYKNAELNIAGDNLTFQEANAIFKQDTGKEIPTTYSLLAALLPLFMPEIRKMFDFFNDPGFAAKPEESKKLQPVTNFQSWVKKSGHLLKTE